LTAKPFINAMKMKRMIAAQRMPHHIIFFMANRTQLDFRERLRYVVLFAFNIYNTFLRNGHYVQDFALAKTRVEGVDTVLYDVLVRML